MPRIKYCCSTFLRTTQGNSFIFLYFYLTSLPYQFASLRFNHSSLLHSSLLHFLVFCFSLVTWRQHYRCCKCQYMLSYSDFEPLEPSSRQSFKFKKLRPISQGSDIYAQSSSNRKYRVTLFTNRSQAETLSQLWKRGVWGNLKGLFRKKHLYYAIAQAESSQTLAEYLEKYHGRGDLVTELFCLQLIESVIDLATICEQLGCSIKILNPFYLLPQQREGKVTVRLKYPYCHSLFQGLSCEVVSREAEFCAPEILLLAQREYDLANQVFWKAAVYSLGLVVLYCFGYRIKSEERVLAVRSGKEFAMFLKAIRKEIKVFHEGKFTSKLIKILLEQSEEVRDNLQTFALKLHSPHLQSLRKFVFRPEAVKDSYIPTIYSDHSEIARKSRLNRTIEIQGSSSASNKSEQQSRENGREGGRERSIFHFPTFRKSAESVFQQDLVEEHPGESRQERQREWREGKGQLGQPVHWSSNGQLPSPVDIKIDWQDQETDEVPHSTRRSMTPVKKHLPGHEGQQLESMAVREDTAVGREAEKFSYTEAKRSKARVEPRWRIQEQVQGQNESHAQETQGKSKQQLNDQSSISLSRKAKDAAEQQPEIIKYDFDNDLAHRQVRKKACNKQSVELQDMTLVEEHCEDEDEPEDADPPNTRLEELNAELGKKAEALFVILLVSFLIYKIIDYVIT